MRSPLTDNGSWDWWKIAWRFWLPTPPWSTCWRAYWTDNSKEWWFLGEEKSLPKSSNLIGFSIINHPFWGTPIFGNTHVKLFTVQLSSRWRQSMEVWWRSYSWGEFFRWLFNVDSTISKSPLRHQHLREYVWIFFPTTLCKSLRTVIKLWSSWSEVGDPFLLGALGLVLNMMEKPLLMYWRWTKIY